MFEKAKNRFEKFINDNYDFDFKKQDTKEKMETIRQFALDHIKQRLHS